MPSLQGNKKVEKGTLIEHSSYCFGKILDYLYLKQLQSQGLLEEQVLPSVVDWKKCRFEKVTEYYFLGDCKVHCGLTRWIKAG